MENHANLNNDGVDTVTERLEIRPDTRRTAQLVEYEQKLEKQKQDKAEALRKEREEFEAKKRLREQEDSRYLSEHEQRRQEEERKRKEEELQRQFESPINKIIRSLNNNEHMPYICMDSVSINQVEIRLLSQALGVASGCKYLILHSKDLCDEDGEAMALGLSSNKSITHVNLDRNKLGLLTLRAFSSCLKSNTYLEYLSLEGNNLTFSGTSFEAFSEFMEAASTHHSICGLNLSNCWLAGPCADYIINCLENNARITYVEMTRNSIPFSQLQEINRLLIKNRGLCEQLIAEIIDETRLMRCAEQGSINYVNSIEQCRADIERTEKHKIQSFWERVRKYKEMYVAAEEQKNTIMQKLQEDAERVATPPVKSKLKKKAK